MRLGHPRYATLSRFADGDLPETRNRRVADHLADCSRCRQEVAFIRQAGALARSLETPAAPRAILDRVMAQRAAGDRVLLPPEAPGRAAPNRHRWPMAVAAVITLLVAGLFLSTELLEADRGGLRILPIRPAPGQQLSVSYDGDFRFRGHEHLRLRARYRTGSGREWQQLAAILSRDDESFTADVSLPDSVVYAVFAVEDLHGEQVDSRSGRLWEVVARAPDGRPALAALDQRFVDLFVRDEVEAYRTALTMTELYPESARAWSRRWTVERRDMADSIRQFHLERFKALERGLSETPPADPDELAHMAWYALALGQWSSVEYWIREATRRNARAAPLYQAHGAYIRLTPGLDPGRALEELEALWAQAPQPVPAIADAGWWFATAAADWDAAVRWLARLRHLRGIENIGWHLTLTDVFPSRQVLDWVLGPGRDVLLEDPSGHRPLHRSVSGHRRIVAESRQAALARIARIALAGDRDSAAVALATDAVPLGWRTEALEELGSILLEAGRTADAADAYARAAADPIAGPIPDAIRELDGWEARVAAARAELHRRVLQDLVMRFLPDPLEPSAGPAVTVFLSSCAREHIREINRLADMLPSDRLHVYTTPGIGSSPEELGACGLEPPARFDSEGALRRAYVIHAHPDYFITDSRGRIRFQHTKPAEIPRQLEALERTAVPAVQD
ncbi:MAG: zf-HC2 domain-containing protein [Longimicrobiales bacterium]|nr:zf-HC2 domain-containing protein [Longimicrobiales bacterium]